MKTTWCLLLASVALVLMTPRNVEATGACTAARFHDWNDAGCNKNYAGAGAAASGKIGAGGNQSHCSSGCGMPRWWVSEPYINLCMEDTPLSYTLSSGQEMAFRFYYRQRTKLPNSDEVSSYLPAGDVYPSETTCGTNAYWGNNWTMSIKIWDTQWETNWVTVPDGLGGYKLIPPSNYPPYSQGYQAFFYRPEGGIDYYKIENGSSSAVDAGSLVSITNISASSYPWVTTRTGNSTISNAPTADAGGIYWGDSGIGVKLVYPDGSQDIFGLTLNPIISMGVSTLVGSAGNSTAHLLLTQRLDPQGRLTKLGYERETNTVPYGFRIRFVVDPDGRTNIFSYDSGFQLKEIADPYGRKTTLRYNGKGLLTNIVDAVGITNSFKYLPGPPVTNWNWHLQGGQMVQYGPPDPAEPPYATITEGNPNGWMTNLATPYGNTRFCYHEVSDTSVTDGFQQRAIYVTEPTGAGQFYCYLHNNSSVPSTDTAPSVSGHTFDDGNVGSQHQALTYRNTYYWGRRQFAALASSVSDALTGAMNYQASDPATSDSYFASALGYLDTADYKKARLRHWLMWSGDNLSITEALSSERDPSPDAAGQSAGLRTWYDYPDKPSGEPELLGSNSHISCIARLLPGSSSQYTTYNFYSASYPYGGGLVSDNASTYSKPDGSVGVLTNWFHYASGGVDLISISNSAGQYVNYGYNTGHQITTATNALGQITTLNWDASTRNLTGIQPSSGKSISLSYYATATPPTNTSAMVQQITIQPEGRVFTISNYSAGLPASITDDRNVTVSNTWDGLNRLTCTAFSDGTTVSNNYNRLDLGATKDRLNNWTYYGFDGLQHLTAVTNANNAVTTYSWCGCGSLTTILDALTNLTSLNYDNQGNLTNVVFPDYSSITYQFDLAGRMTNVFDGAGRALQIGYNNQGVATSITGDNGLIRQRIFDAINRPINVTDANGLTVTNSFDAINQLIKRTWPDGISEGYGYGTAGLIVYTNRNSQRTLYGRDGAGRLTAVTNANQEVTRFGYDSLNNVTNLIDGLNHTTTWQYNQYGWLTNKVDGLSRNAFRYAYNANGWVTNRWTPEKGNTGYTYDNVGNLKSIVYPQQTNGYAYDALNRLTNMVDAVGTTVFSYTVASLLQSENGPWSNDTVTYTYTHGLRTALSLSQPSGTWSQSYGYDSGWRMTNVASSAGSFGYSYNVQPASALITGISLPNGANITNSYDSLARLTETALNDRWGHALDAYSYIPDTLGLRTNIVRNLGLSSSTVTAGFDSIGQLISWNAKETGGASRLNEQLGWAYDAAHNLLRRTNNLLLQTFTVDAANELTNVSRAGTFTESGVMPAPATSVTVNGQTAQTYNDFTFARTNLSLASGNNTFTNIAQNAYGLKVTNILTVNLPSSVTLNSDSNGSLTNDGVRILGYDSENQLTNVMVAGAWKSEFVYDGLNRRRIARDYNWNGSVWVKTNEILYVYDGLLLVQERDTNSNPLVTYTRGLDLSGSFSKAGGIGGLLARTDTNGSAFYHADGVGNITALMDGNENIVARYLYNPFGKLIGQWGTMAGVNTMQFSSMPQLHGLSLYAFRAYDPNLQRWPNQDPIGERGGINLHRFVHNNPINLVDPLGLAYGNPVSGPNGIEGPASSYNSGGGLYPNGYLYTPQQLPGVPSPLDVLGEIGESQDRAMQDMAQAIADLSGNGGDPSAVAGIKHALDTVATVAMPEGDLGKASKFCPTKLAAKKISQIDRAAFRAEREAFWKAEAKNNPGKYSGNDLAKMKQGRAPIGPDGYPIELHHIDQTPDGGLEPMSRTDHRLGENYKKNHP